MEAMRRAGCARLVAGAAGHATAVTFESDRGRCGCQFVTAVECDRGEHLLAKTAP